MSQKIRVTTRADLFLERKEQYIRAGYQIEDEQPALNGMRSFTAVHMFSEEEASGLDELKWAQAASARRRLNKTRSDAKNSRSRNGTKAR